MAPVLKKSDDFTIENRSNAAARGGSAHIYVLRGPGIVEPGVLYDTREEAERDGRMMAERERVSLWYEEKPHTNRGIFIATWRPKS